MCRVFRSAGEAFVGSRIMVAVVVFKSRILYIFITSFASYSQFDHRSLRKVCPVHTQGFV